MKKKIIITYLINSFDSGGTENQLLNLVKLLKKQFIIKIFSFSDGILSREFRKEGIEITIGNNGYSILKLISFLIKNDTHIYHFFLPKSYIIGGILTLLSKKKKIMSRRSLNNYHKKYFYISLLIEKFLHKKMDYILANDNSIKNQILKTELKNEKKVLLIKNFLIEKNSSFSSKKSQKFISFGLIANFIPYKGHIDLINACKQINSKKDWRLFFYGSDRNNYKSLVKKIVKENGLQKKVVFGGFKKNKSSIYNNLDFIVNVSSEEGSSNVLLESLFYKKPILAIDVGGNKEFVNGKNGFLVKKNDSLDLRKKIIKMIESKNLKKMSIESQKIYKNFDSKIALKAYQKVYS